MFLKSLVFGTALFIVSAADFNLISILFFVLASFSLYSRPLFGGPYNSRHAFIVLLCVSILGMKIMAGSFLFFPGLFLFSFLFFLILGIKEILFVKRSRIYYIAALLLFYALFVIFFLADKSSFYIFKYSGIIVASFLLFREWLAIVSVFHFPKREFISSLVAAFIIAQLLWAVALLPIGFIMASNLMLLFTLILGNFLFAHFTGNLSKDFIIQYSVLFLFLVSLIACFSWWV